MLEEILSGLSGALRGGFEGYSWAKQVEDDRAWREDQKRAREAELRHRRNREGVADMERQAALIEKQKQREAQQAIVDGMPDGPLKEAARAAMSGLNVPYQAYNDVFERNEAARKDTELHEALEPTLPEHLRQPFHVSGHKGTYKPDEFASPAERARVEGERDRAKRRADLGDYEAKKRIDQKFEKPEKPKPDDDPALPKGVVAYIATLPSKYRGDYAQAAAELQRAMPDLLRDHPRMDVRKARSAFDALFPAAAIPRPQSGRGAGERQRVLPPRGSSSNAPPQTAQDPREAIRGEAEALLEQAGADSSQPVPSQPAPSLPITPRGAAPKDGTQPLYRWPDGTRRAYPPPPDAQPRPTRDEARAARGLPPRASAAPTGPSTGAATAPPADPRLAEPEAQATALHARVRAERDPAKREQLRAEYLKLRAQREAVLRGGAR